MSRSLLYSIILHFCLVLLFVFGFPSFWTPAPEELVITLEMLPVGNKTNIKPRKTDTTNKYSDVKKDVQKSAELKPTETDEQSKKDKSSSNDIKEQKKQKLTENTSSEADKESTKRIKEDDKTKKKDKKEEKKQEHQEEKNKASKKQNKKNKQKHENDFDSLLKTLEENTTDKKSDKKVKNQKNKELDSLLDDINDKSDSNNYDNTAPLSLTDKDAIRVQIEKHWNIPAGAKDAKDLLVKLRISIKPDGVISNVEILDESRYNSDKFYASAADSAVRAAHKASPLIGLPADKYNNWKEVELYFNPAEILR